MDDATIDIIKFWPLFLVAIPLLVGIFSITFAPFITVRGKRTPFKSLLRFTFACGIIAVAYIGIAVGINSISEYAKSASISKPTKDVDFDVYQFNAQFPDLDLVSRTINNNTYKSSNPNSLITPGVYIKEIYHVKNGGTQTYTLYEFNNSRVPSTSVSSCMPINPFSSYNSQKTKDINCVDIGKNSVGNTIYNTRRVNSVTPDGYTFYYYDGISTVYGNTRITATVGTDYSPVGKEFLAAFSNVRKVDVRSLKFFEQSSGQSQLFILPSLF